MRRSIAFRGRPPRVAGGRSVPFGMAARGLVCYSPGDMKREKQLTKRERKALKPGRPAPAAQDQHIHCVACGAHLDAAQFAPPASAQYVRCKHGSQWASCTACVPRSRALLEEHDRTGQPVQAAGAWH